MIYNDQPPLIVYSGNNYVPPNWAIEYDMDEPDNIIHRSIITGYRTVVAKGNYFAASIVISGLTIVTYNTWKALRGQTVTFYPYGNGTITEGQTTYTLPSLSCIVTKVKYFHKDNAIFTDACIVSLISQAYYDLLIAAPQQP